MIKSTLFTFFIIFYSKCSGKVTDKKYAETPPIFHNDNYDHCMLRGDEALFCSFTYKLRPLNSSNTNEIWKTIEELGSKRENYKHDLLRHAICIPETCPDVNHNRDLLEEINQCYDNKFRDKQLKGTITELKCETNKSVYPIDWIDVIVGLLFMSYFIFIAYASIHEVLNSHVPKREQQNTSTRDRVVEAFSITRNWKRLVTVKGEESEQWRAIQGVRFYNSLIVILSHTVLIFVASPVANTKYPETVTEKFLTLFLASGPLAVGTNFFLATFLLTHGIYSQLEGKTFKLSLVFGIFFGRIMRLLPAYAVLILFVGTWLRHLGNGPYWNFFATREFTWCRKNGWTNFLFLNTIINKEEMCVPHTWYLAQDTQNFLIALLLIWIFKKNQKLMWPTLGFLMITSIYIVFIQYYTRDFECLIYPYPEVMYNLNSIRVHPQWYFHLVSFFGNLLPSFLGIAAGYGYYVNQKTDFLSKYKNFLTKYYNIFTYGPGLTTTLLPGVVAIHIGMEHSAFWASFYNAFARIIFTVGASGAVILCTLGYGGMTKKVLEWPPTLFLGRLSYSAYLIHFMVLFVRAATIRYPIHLSDYSMTILYVSDIAVSYAAALAFTLLFELPMSGLQKIMFNVNEINYNDLKNNKSTAATSVNGLKNGFKKD